MSRDDVERRRSRLQRTHFCVVVLEQYEFGILRQRVSSRAHPGPCSSSSRRASRREPSPGFPNRGSETAPRNPHVAMLTPERSVSRLDLPRQLSVCCSSFVLLRPPHHKRPIRVQREILDRPRKIVGGSGDAAGSHGEHSRNRPVHLAAHATDAGLDRPGRGARAGQYQSPPVPLPLRGGAGERVVHLRAGRLQCGYMAARLCAASADHRKTVAGCG